MNYGRTGRTSSTGTQDFFTAGAGTNSEDINVFESENNLDLSNDTVSWDNPAAANNINRRNIGNTAMHSEKAIPQEESAREVSTPELGKIVNLEMPPIDKGSAPKDHSKMAEASLDAGILLNLESFREENDKISSKTLESTEQAVEDFEKGKISPADLDDARWKATKAYLKNSFGRDIAA